MLEYSPAFGLVNFGDKNGFQARLLQQEKYKKVCTPPGKLPEITPAFFFDTLTIGYHEETLRLLLPYNPMFDNITWHLSAVLQIYRTKAILYRHGMANWNISVLN